MCCFESMQTRLGREVWFEVKLPSFREVGVHKQVEIQQPRAFTSTQAHGGQKVRFRKNGMRLWKL